MNGRKVSVDWDAGIYGSCYAEEFKEPHLAQELLHARRPGMGLARSRPRRPLKAAFQLSTSLTRGAPAEGEM